MTEDGRQKTEGGERKTEERIQRTDDRGQTTEGGTWEKRYGRGFTRYAGRDTRYGARAGCHHLCKTNPIFAGAILGLTSFQALGYRGDRPVGMGRKRTQSKPIWSRREVRRTEGRGQRTEGGGQTTEGRGTGRGSEDLGFRACRSGPARQTKPIWRSRGPASGISNLRSQIRPSGLRGGLRGQLGELSALQGGSGH